MRFFVIITVLVMALCAYAPTAQAQYVPQQQPQDPSAVPDAEGTGKLCLQLKPQKTYINIDVMIPEPTYDLTKDMKTLTREMGRDSSQEWLSKNNLDKLWTADEMVNPGYTATGWQVLPEFFVKATPVDRFGAWYCPHILEASIAILMESKIHVAREYPKGSCEYEAIEAHEYKHYLVNKYVVEQAMDKMRRDLPQIIQDMEEQGYVGRGMVNDRVELIKQAIADVFKVYVRDEMVKQMEQLNHEVDTPGEYDRVSKLLDICKVKARMANGSKRKQEGFSGEIKTMGEKK